jgi:hypothetical protein
VGNLDIILRLTGQDNGATRMIQGAKSEGQALDKTMSRVGANTGLREAGTQAKGLETNLKSASDSGSRLGATLENARNWGAGIAVAGGAALLLAENFTNSFLEADRLGGRLNSLMKGNGLGDSIGKVKELSNELAGLTGGDDDQIAAGLAGIISSGRLTALKEYGIVLDDTAKKNIEAAGKISAQAKSQAILNEVLRAGKTATDNLRAGMDSSTAALGEMSTRYGNLTEGIGAGSAAVKAALYAGVIDPIFDILEASPGLQSTVGAVTAIGGAGMATLGSLLGIVAQIGMAIPAFEAMGFSGVASLSAIKAAAFGTTVGFNLATVAVTGIAIAAAATVGAVAYAVGQHIGLIDQEQTYLERLTAGWERLKGIVTGTNVEWAQNEKDLETEITQMKAGRAKRVLGGTMTQEEADKRNREGEIKLREKFAREQMRIGDEKNLVKNQEAAARLKQTGALAATPPAVVLPPPVVAAALPLSPAVAAASTPTATHAAKVPKAPKAHKETSKDRVKAALAAGARIMPDGSLFIPDFTIETDEDEGAVYEALTKGEKGKGAKGGKSHGFGDVLSRLRSGAGMASLGDGSGSTEASTSGGKGGSGKVAFNLAPNDFKTNTLADGTTEVTLLAKFIVDTTGWRRAANAYAR